MDDQSLNTLLTLLIRHKFTILQGGANTPRSKNKPRKGPETLVEKAAPSVTVVFIFQILAILSGFTGDISAEFIERWKIVLIEPFLFSHNSENVFITALKNSLTNTRQTVLSIYSALRHLHNGVTFLNNFYQFRFRAPLENELPFYVSRFRHQLIITVDIKGLKIRFTVLYTKYIIGSMLP